MALKLLQTKQNDNLQVLKFDWTDSQDDKIVPLSKKQSLNGTSSRKSSVTKLDRKNSKNVQTNGKLGHTDNSYKYVDPNASFLVHDVVKRGICETFVIDFEPNKKAPPKLSWPKSSTPSSSPSTLSTPFSSPSAAVKSKNKVNNAMFTKKLHF